ncbi:HNH endonuclease [Alteribacter natronophilus]|uniref:HNH endonuclease n=1 Tax=Alteribacter natronophilus TaxID=2583810 RepID=UPI00110ED383|nr:HNH endonuclease [Alteribacter natronophilus]TMW70631.1 HNH endonuclease [Alteribacter natronophilus]
MKNHRGTCELCQREGVRLTEHHLIPKEEGGTFLETVMLCPPCHRQIHNLYTNREIALRLGSIERLRDDDKIRKFLKWIRKQPATAGVKMKKSNERRRKKR